MCHTISAAISQMACLELTSGLCYKRITIVNDDCRWCHNLCPVLLNVVNDTSRCVNDTSRSAIDYFRVALQIRGNIHNTSFSLYFMNWANKLRVFGTCKPFQLSVIKQSSLLGWFVSYEENRELWIQYQNLSEFLVVIRNLWLILLSKILLFLNVVKRASKKF